MTEIPSNKSDDIGAFGTFDLHGAAPVFGRAIDRASKIGEVSDRFHEPSLAHTSGEKSRSASNAAAFVLWAESSSPSNPTLSFQVRNLAALLARETPQFRF